MANRGETGFTPPIDGSDKKRLKKVELPDLKSVSIDQVLEGYRKFSRISKDSSLSEIQRLSARRQLEHYNAFLKDKFPGTREGQVETGDGLSPEERRMRKEQEAKKVANNEGTRFLAEIDQMISVLEKTGAPLQGSGNKTVDAQVLRQQRQFIAEQLQRFINMGVSDLRKWTGPVIQDLDVGDEKAHELFRAVTRAGELRDKFQTTLRTIINVRTT